MNKNVIVSLLLVIVMGVSLAGCGPKKAQELHIFAWSDELPMEVGRAFLHQVGGRQVADDALRRQREADGGERAAYPLAALAHGLVGQADQHEVHLAARRDHLGVDLPHIDAFEGHGLDAGGHG